MKKNELPSTVFVQWYKDGNDGNPKTQGTYLTATDDQCEAADSNCGVFEGGEYVGVYKLIEIVKLKLKPREVVKHRRRAAR